MTHLAGPAEAGGVAALLRGTEGVAGLAWASVDNSCRLDYSVRMEVRAGIRFKIKWKKLCINTDGNFLKTSLF